MILIYGLLYFGYATLGRQRQDKATAYSAWAAAPQQATSLVSQFWAWNGPASGPANPALPNSSSAIAGDTTFSVYGGSLTGQWVRPSDEYYGMTIPPPNGTVFIPCQLAAGHWAGWPFGNYFFDSERVSVDLWNFALGATTQSFNWTPGQGIMQQFNTNYTDFANYLNQASPVNLPTQGGLLLASAAYPPTPTELALDEPWPNGWGWRLANALNGPPPPAAGPWLQRSAVESTMTYNDPLFVRFAYAEQGAPPSTFNQYISGNNTAPASTSWMTATMDCDVTGRNTASVRQGAEEGAQNFLAGVGVILGASGTLPASNSMDAQILNSSGTTIQQAWTPW
jgi:hypothetical protein